MTRLNVARLAGRFVRKVREVGLFETLRIAVNRLSEQPADGFPLARADRSALFAINTDEIRAKEKKKMRATAMLYEASHVESTYPLVLEWNGRLMRYAFLPATEQSKGLVVLFHGHNAHLHLGPVAPWQHFDILAPWDTFGWHRQGSWFWGEKGDNFVEHMVFDLISKYRERAPDRPWFCMGGSMGAFAALYHGIKYHCDGLYVMAPQVDLRAKIIDYGRDNRDNPYGYLQGETLDKVPDLLALAEAQETLPPLFLVQHQYDPVNCFAHHAFRLLDIYNRKNAWYGVRVHPAIGHGGDGSQREAVLFFSLIVDKAPPKRVKFCRAATLPDQLPEQSMRDDGMISVSVVMPVYNGERYLREAVESILNQTFTNFEFIIVNDGSTDGTRAILESYDDSRIVLVHNQENIGLTGSLNKGLDLAQGEYVARMDADDVAMPHRFEKQIAFLEKNPEVGILGSNCRLIDAEGRERGLYQVPKNDLQIRWTSLLTNPFAHPTVMIRRHVLTQNGLNYDEAFQTAQDYDLWMRTLKYTRGANLSEPLMQYRLCLGLTSTHRETQLKNQDTIALRTIQERLPGFVITLGQVSQLRALFVGGSEFTPGFDRQRVALAKLYLDMFEIFVSHYPGESDLKALQCQEVLRVARLVLPRPLQPGWVRVVGRLITMDPGLFLSYLLNAIGR